MSSDSLPRIRVFDTTLRDGEQSPGCTMSVKEKLAVARQLVRLGVDVIEAGFPAASRAEWEAVHTIAVEFAAADVVICGLARATERDIDECAAAIAAAGKRRIHTFLATSNIHMEHKLRLTRPQVLLAIAQMVAHAREYCDDVEFSPEDASRSEAGFLHEALAVAIEAGATTLNIPDTVGYATPEEYGRMIARIRAEVPGAERVVLSTHCHNDLGLAVANSLAGLRAGARQVECTINGIGERAGNAALEEVCMALQSRRDEYALATRIDAREIGRSSRLVSLVTGMRVPPNKAIVGMNAFAHEAGIHQDGVIKHRETYEFMDAESVGAAKTRLVLGKHSGRRALRTQLEAFGHSFSEEQFEQVFARFKDVADRKKVVDDRDIDAMVAAVTQRSLTVYALDHVQVSTGSHAIPTATVRLRGPDSSLGIGSSQGDGPVDAICRAIDQVTRCSAELVEFSVDAVTEGVDAAGGVTVRLRAPVLEPSLDAEARVFTGVAVHTDILVATAEAYVAAFNAMIQSRQRLTTPSRTSHVMECAS